MILALAVYLFFVTHQSGKRLQNIWMLVYYAATDSSITSTSTYNYVFPPLLWNTFVPIPTTINVIGNTV